MNPLTELLAGRDRWSGAACAGLWDVFDPRRDDETADDYEARVYRAQTVCGTCPILADCRDFAGNARPRDRTGVWAGIAYDHRGRPVRIPSKESK
ncbi:WhiB family transcriptional regulator [Dietzia sp. 179-F 9C3 NHS]|uniref:WhiB family transcriptional regulator n=1 Tax=Dietzia sp. 179-F 9C3 NHS TaxID=3374295 RepID=UPI00387917FF